jgi:hypothetical protein
VVVKEPVKEGGKEQYSAEKVYRIGQEAADICGKYQMPPRDVIVHLEGVVQDQRGRISTEAAVESAVRKVTQVEGVMLHEKQKGFFRDLFASLMNYWAGEKK